MKICKNNKPYSRRLQGRPKKIWKYNGNYGDGMRSIREDLHDFLCLNIRIKINKFYVKYK